MEVLKNENSLTYNLINDIINNQKLQPLTRLYVLLRVICSKNAKISPTNSFLANRLNMSTRTINRCLNRLKIANIIYVEYIQKEKYQKRTIFFITNDILVNNIMLNNDTLEFLNNNDIYNLF